WTGGRSLYFSFDLGARLFSARWGRPALPGADLDGHGRALGGTRGTDHRRRPEQREKPRGDPVGTSGPAAGEGYAGAAHQADGRHVRASRGRDAAKSDQAAARTPDRVRTFVIQGYATRSRGILWQSQGIFRNPSEPVLIHRA